MRRKLLRCLFPFLLQHMFQESHPTPRRMSKMMIFHPFPTLFSLWHARSHSLNFRVVDPPSLFRSSPVAAVRTEREEWKIKEKNRTSNSSSPIWRLFRFSAFILSAKARTNVRRTCYFLRMSKIKGFTLGSGNFVFFFVLFFIFYFWIKV